MAAVKDARTVSAGFGNQVDYYRVIYDIAADGGAIGALDLLTASGKLVIVHAHMKVLSAVTASGSATVKWGVTGDDDRFANTTQGAKANLTSGAVILPLALEGTPNVIATPHCLADGEKVLMTIGTDTLLTGKIEFVIGVLKP